MDASLKTGHIVIGCIIIAFSAFIAGSFIRRASQAGYPAGTVIETYKSFPPGLPPEILAESFPLKSVAVVKYPDGGESASFSYFSAQSTASVVNLYGSKLRDSGWSVRSEELQFGSAVVSAAKDSAEMNITFIPSSGGTELNFLYKKSK